MNHTKQSLLRSTLQQLAACNFACGELARDWERFDRLMRCSVHDDDLCQRVLDFCAPALDALEPAPEQGRLPLLAEKLVDNLFPDAEHPARELTAAEELYLTVLECFFRYDEAEFDPVTDVLKFPESEIEQSRVREEYDRFRRAFDKEHIMALLRLSRETGTFNLAGHVIGVHNVALHTALLARKAGFAVDLPLVSAAALGHDIGKYGCRDGDSTRVPYLHYYYTYQWFTDHGMDEIGYISANHSTWDLEFENLPIESLLLIYADFRVRGHRGEDGREVIDIHPLSEAYRIIFSKLANMTPEKQARYSSVYSKLRDFELLLAGRGVPDDIRVDTLGSRDDRDPAMMNASEALQGLCGMALEGSMELMHTVSVGRTFTRLLEQAKSGLSMHSIRTYLNLFREFSTYMTKQNKKILLNLLYEMLVHPDGDVRRTAGEIMGEILANSGPKYRKERPGRAQSDLVTPAMAALLDEAVELWEQYIELCLHPDRKNSPRHALRISNSLKTITRSLFKTCDEKDAGPMLAPLLNAFFTAEGPDRFALVDSIGNVPPAVLAREGGSAVIDRLAEILQDSSEHLKLISLNCLQQLSEAGKYRHEIAEIVSGVDHENTEAPFALHYMKCRILGTEFPRLSDSEISGLYLSNLKNAVHWTIKITQVGLLEQDAREMPQDRFHVALHFSNMLCVSEHLPVREFAGECLLRIAPMLTVDQINEIAFDLLRELETGQAQIIRFIPPYIGRLLCLLPEKELSEAVDNLENMVRSSSSRTARVALSALAVIIVNEKSGDPRVASRLLGILMTGIGHYDAEVHETALRVLCVEVFGSGNLPLEQRGTLFCLLHKKLFTLLSEKRSGQLSFFNRAAMLNHLYRFIVEYKVTKGDFPFAPERPAAFFPGTFDPFSVGHKQIVERIREQGFEVYLAVDEFSWSKKTVAKLLRRQIVSMSVSDQWDTYLFPDDVPINIAMPNDLAKLSGLLPGRELYLVAGSDVIRNASAYRSSKPGAAPDYNHIVFSRGEAVEDTEREFANVIRGKLRVLALPDFYETVSSTRIREYVDRRLDISMLVDPVVQSFIYANGLYVRSPESKNVLSPRDLSYVFTTENRDDLPESLRLAMQHTAASCGVVLYAKQQLMGWGVGRTIHAMQLFEVLHSVETAGYVRSHTSGRILLIERVRAERGEAAETTRMLLNELLVRSLSTDHTYALSICPQEDFALRSALSQLGFVQVENCEDVFYVDMRNPVMLLQDALLSIKQPHQDDDDVKQAVASTRPRLRGALNRMFLGQLLVCFDSEQLNQALMERIMHLNNVESLPEGVRLGPNMCVPYGKILSDVVVPHTVTKTLHVEKCFSRDIRSFDFVEYPGYSPIRNQVRMLKSFERPVLLVDDLLHNGYRIDRLDKIFRAEGLVPEKIVVAIMSGNGRDLMRVQDREVECEYFIPNLHYWVTESLLYPFIGGDSVTGHRTVTHMLPSINLILPYYYPSYFRDADDRTIRALSRTALENTLEILQELENAHQRLCDTALTISRLAEALQSPRLPEQGECMQYDFNLPASAYVQDSLNQLERMCRREK